MLRLAELIAEFFGRKKKYPPIRKSISFQCWKRKETSTEEIETSERWLGKKIRCLVTCRNCTSLWEGNEVGTENAVTVLV